MPCDVAARRGSSEARELLTDRDMAANDPVDPTVAEADRRVERAKASLLARVEVLKHKLGDVKHQVSVQAQIAKHPLPAIGIAFAVGALVALGRPRRAHPREAVEQALTTLPKERSLGKLAFGAIATFGLRMLRELAVAQLGNAAKQWWVEQGRGTESRTEHDASRTPDIEPFLEH